MIVSFDTCPFPLSVLRQELARLDGISPEEVKRMVVALQRELARVERVARKRARSRPRKRPTSRVKA